MPFFPNTRSFSHEDNGMSLPDMAAILSVARRRNEIICFRSTGRWSLRWIQRGHPTKPFHVKGKSSDWGPQAGFVPWRGIYSKVGHDPAAAKKGDAKNAEGIAEGFAKRILLQLSKSELDIQARERAKGRTALSAVRSTAGWPTCRADQIIYARRPGDQKQFAFWARWELFSPGRYALYVFPEALGTSTVQDLYPKRWQAELLEVMGTAEEAHTQRGSLTTDLPLTGDYDLFAVGPTWGAYGPDDRKIDVTLDDGRTQQLMKRLQKQAAAAVWKIIGNRPVSSHELASLDSYNHLQRAPKKQEDPDKGNVTKRIIDVMNAMNTEMALLSDPVLQLSDSTLMRYLDNTASTMDFWSFYLRLPPLDLAWLRRRLEDQLLFRRVHHNAESGRPFIDHSDFAGALPVTAFLPRTNLGPRAAFHANILTFTDTHSVTEFFKTMYGAGYVLPKNRHWQMGSFLSEITDDRGHDVARAIEQNLRLKIQVEELIANMSREH